VTGGWLRAAVEDSLHPRLQSGASGRPLNFTVRRHSWHCDNVWRFGLSQALDARGSV
jgi:hypothetical protein